MNVLVKSCVFDIVKTNIIARSVATCLINKSEFDNLNHPEGREPSIPPYVERENENIDLKRARLLYQSRKRGMLENGLVLSTFAKKYLNTFNDEELKLYDRLINLPSNDWDLFYWAIGVKPTPPEFDNDIMNLLKKHVENNDKQSRIVQPDL